MSKIISDDLELKQQSQQLLLKTNIKALQEGRDLLKLIDPSLYIGVCSPAFQAAIGEHFRHILEHYLCFFDQLESATFCYDQRQRNQHLEEDSAFAVETIIKLERNLQKLDHSCFRKKYLLRDQQANDLVETSLERELLFLQSHTIHHYAIIAAITRAYGIQPKEDFGVAIATRAFQKEQRESGICAQ